MEELLITVLLKMAKAIEILDEQMVGESKLLEKRLELLHAAIHQIDPDLMNEDVQREIQDGHKDFLAKRETYHEHLQTMMREIELGLRDFNDGAP